MLSVLKNALPVSETEHLPANFRQPPDLEPGQEAEHLVDGGLDEWLRDWCTDEAKTFRTSPPNY